MGEKHSRALSQHVFIDWPSIAFNRLPTHFMYAPSNFSHSFGLVCSAASSSLRFAQQWLYATLVCWYKWLQELFTLLGPVIIPREGVYMVCVWCVWVCVSVYTVSSWLAYIYVYSKDQCQTVTVSPFLPPSPCFSLNRMIAYPLVSLSAISILSLLYGCEQQWE